MMTRNLFMYGILAIAVLLVMWTLHRRDKRRDSKFSLDDLLLDETTGQASLSKCLLAAAFFLMAWQMVYLTVNNKMDLSYFSQFGNLWVLPFGATVLSQVGKAFAARKVVPAAAPPAQVNLGVVQQEVKQ